MKERKIVIIGGGAAGIFAAITAARQAPHAQVIVLEKTRQLLAKVKISGGGRCNVTHAAFDPKMLVQNYPRGSKELLGSFYRFQPRDTIAWFAERGVKIKTEEDGRMFPVTDSSETIVECLLNEAKKCKVDIRLEQKIKGVEKTESGFQIHFDDQTTLASDCLLLATGSSPQGHAIAQNLGHTIVPLVPSLFTFNIPTSPLLELSGITVPDAVLSLKGSTLKQRGALLLTHWGFSGPAALKLSAWAARFLHEKNYKTELLIHWLPEWNASQIVEQLLAFKGKKPLKNLENENLFSLPTNLWKKLMILASIPERTPISHVSNKSLQEFGALLAGHSFQIEGKTTYKQEFVTCGGIDLKEIDFKTMQSRIVNGLYCAGEFLDVDGVTGGFNFQNAWTSGWIAGHAMAGK